MPTYEKMCEGCGQAFFTPNPYATRCQQCFNHMMQVTAEVMADAGR